MTREFATREQAFAKELVPLLSERLHIPQDMLRVDEHILKFKKSGHEQYLGVKISVASKKLMRRTWNVLFTLGLDNARPSFEWWWHADPSTYNDPNTHRYCMAFYAQNTPDIEHGLLDDRKIMEVAVEIQKLVQKQGGYPRMDINFYRRGYYGPEIVCVIDGTRINIPSLM
jgi:hypothetical protein